MKLKTKIGILVRVFLLAWLLIWLEQVFSEMDRWIDFSLEWWGPCGNGVSEHHKRTLRWWVEIQNKLLLIEVSILAILVEYPVRQILRKTKLKFPYVAALIIVFLAVAGVLFSNLSHCPRY